MSGLHTVKLREGKAPAETVTSAALEIMRAHIVGFNEAYDVEDAAPEKPAVLAKVPHPEAVEAKAEKSK